MEFSRRAIMVGAATMAGTPLAARAAPPRLDPSTARLIAKVSTDALHAGACAGVQLAISRRGVPLLSQGFGLANIETRTPTTDLSVFRIGSLTKQFTAAAVVKLAAEGRLELDEPVSKYLPFMGRIERVTLLELLHHTAGLHSDEDGSNPPTPIGPAGPKTQVLLAEEIARQAKPFDFPPGTAWLYSNANYIVLGAVMEALTRRPLAEVLSDLIFVPLALRATAMDRSAEVVRDRVAGYSPVEGRDPPFENAAYMEISDAGGAGAMRSTALDLCRWHHALRSGQLFDQKCVDLMLTPGRLRDGRLSGANRFSPADASYGDVQYACGLLVSPPGDPRPSILHYGAISGFASVLETHLDSGLTVAILCNGDMGPHTPFRALRRLIATTVSAGA